jgi:ADP-heptose:LPS heptosyltransferase
MGLGDQLLGTGLAKGARARGKRIAFGDRTKIIWDHHSEQVFRKNPNIAPPGSERDGDLEWIPYFRGNRLYNKQGNGRWIWNYGFKAIPGEMYFSGEELQFGRQFGKGFVVVEPNVPEHKTVSPNKQWAVSRYHVVVKELRQAGHDVVQFAHGRERLLLARQIKAPSFRHALAVLKNAALYIGPEGGLHHGAASVGVPAVVLFGGFIPPAVTGYDGHVNLTGGAEACGMLTKCEHCKAAMDSISVAEVLESARAYL